MHILHPQHIFLDEGFLGFFSVAKTRQSGVYKRERESVWWGGLFWDLENVKAMWCGVVGFGFLVNGKDLDAMREVVFPSKQSNRVKISLIFMVRIQKSLMRFVPFL